MTDLHSTNGTRLNDQQLTPGVPMNLRHQDILRIGQERFGISVSFTFRHPAAAPPPVSGFDTLISTTQLLRLHRLTIGRAANSDIVLDSPAVAATHAILERAGDDLAIIRAAEGVEAILVNGREMRRAALAAGDQVQIGPHLFIYDGTALTQYDSQGFRLDVIGMSKEVQTKQGKVRILDDIHFTVMPRELVALVGGSGAGKSTLLDALNGFRPAQGQVLLNGRDLYEHYDSFRQQIGYVPQSDILPGKLRVEEALRYAAQLRLPADTTPAEREQRITAALETVDLDSPRLRQTRIEQLSGGQRKRVSIAAELLADPKLFFLDEPGSGLDPGLEKKLMYTLRRMADEGRTIIVITHATANIVQVDHVGFLSQGKLVFFGPPLAAQEFFGVPDFADIYGQIDNQGEKWQQAFTAGSAAHEEYVRGRQQSRPAMQGETAGKTRRPSLRDTWRQLTTLSRRMTRLILSDRVAFFMALVVMPLVGLLQLGAAEAQAPTGDPGIVGRAAEAAATLTESYTPFRDAHSLLGTMAILAFLAGAFGGSQELLKERSIYLRERMVRLQLLPYLGSKFLVFGGFALLQCLLYLIILSLKVDLPANGQIFIGFLEIFITLWLTMMVGTATGLLISAVSNTPTLALYLVLIMVFFQYIFGGVLYDLRGESIEVLSYGAAARWGTLAMGTTTDVVEVAESTVICTPAVEPDLSALVIDPTTGAPDPASLKLRETEGTMCVNRPVSATDLPLPYAQDEASLLRFWGSQTLIGVLLALGTVLAVRRLDKI